MKYDARDTRGARALSRAQLLAALALLLAPACADPGALYRRAHPGWTPSPPHPGMDLEETVATLYVNDTGPAAEVREIRVLRVDAKPWRGVPMSQVRGGRFKPAEGERYAVIAHRTCSQRELLTRHQAERASWFLFSGDELSSFDHTEFIVRCGVVKHFRPSPRSDLELERALVRYAAQRFPGARPTDEEQVAMGLALLEADRLDEAEAVLARFDRRLRTLAEARRAAPNDRAREKITAEEDEVRPLRNELAAGIASYRRNVLGEPVDPELEFWEGR